jgi:hypothetical protein
LFYLLTDSTPVTENHLFGENTVFEFRLSPDGTRMTWNGGRLRDAEIGAIGCPVFDGSGQLLYSIPTDGGKIDWCYTAFSPDGDTLFVAWRDRTPSERGSRFRAVAGQDGALLDTIALKPFVDTDEHHRVSYIAADPSRSWLYISVYVSRSSLKLIVVDRRDLAVVGVATVPTTAPLPDYQPDELVLVVAEEAVYLIPVSAWREETPMIRYRFDVLPDEG